MIEVDPLNDNIMRLLDRLQNAQITITAGDERDRETARRIDAFLAERAFLDKIRIYEESE